MYLMNEVSTNRSDHSLSYHPDNDDDNVVDYSQEQSNPESSDNTGSGGGGGVGANQLEKDKWSGSGATGGGGNSDGATKSQPQTATKAAVGDTAGNTTTRGGIVENSDLEGPCLQHQAKDSSGNAASSSGGAKGVRKSLPVGSGAGGVSGVGAGAVTGSGTSGGGGAGGGRQLEEAGLEHIPTDMSDTTDSEQDKNLE